MTFGDFLPILIAAMLVPIGITLLKRAFLPVENFLPALITRILLRIFGEIGARSMTFIFGLVFVIFGVVFAIMAFGVILAKL